MILWFAVNSDAIAWVITMTSTFVCCNLSKWFPVLRSAWHSSLMLFSSYANSHCNVSAWTGLAILAVSLPFGYKLFVICACRRKACCATHNWVHLTDLCIHRCRQRFHMCWLQVNFCFQYLLLQCCYRSSRQRQYPPVVVACSHPCHIHSSPGDVIVLSSAIAITTLSLLTRPAKLHESVCWIF